MNVSKSFEKSLFPVLPLKNFHKETIEMKAFYDEVIKEGHDTKNNSQTKNLFEKEIFPRRKLLQFENKESTLISLLEDGYENTVLEYAKFSFLIAKYTSRFFKSNPKLKCPYSWANSFDPKKFIQIDRPEYEHASILYNLAIISYCKAINSALNSNVSIKKKSIDRIRNSLWFLSQIKTMPQSIQSVFQKDLSTKFIAVLEDMFSGVYFGIMCEILKMDCEDLLTSTPSEESLNKYSFNNKLASDFFGRAYTALKEEADFMDNALKNDLDFLQEYYNSRALLYYGKLIKKKNQEAKGYIESSMKIIVKLEKTIKVENKTLIEKDKNTNVSYLKTLIENENEVVKEKIESKNQKNDSNKEFIIKIPVSLDDDIARIEPLEPQNFQEKVDEIENLFSFLIPREKMRIKKEYEDNLFSYELIINQEMNKIEAKIEKMRNDLTIETIIKLKDQKDEDIYIKEFKEKADALKKIYGGLAFYINQRHFLLNMRLNLKRRFEILRERKKGVLDDISLGKLKIDPNKHYKYLEDDILRKFEDSESHKINIDLIEKLTSKDLVIQNFMKTADLNLFNQNKEKIEDLIKLNSDIKTNLETLKTESKDFPKVLNQTKKTFLKVLNANKFGQFLELLSEPAKEFVDKIKKKVRFF